jgi:hypothetical protein
MSRAALAAMAWRAQEGTRALERAAQARAHQQPHALTVRLRAHHLVNERVRRERGVRLALTPRARDRAQCPDRASGLALRVVRVVIVVVISLLRAVPLSPSAVAPSPGLASCSPGSPTLSPRLLTALLPSAVTPSLGSGGRGVIARVQLTP